MNTAADYSQFRVVVVDDEPLPRAHLAHLLREAGVGEVRQADGAVSCLGLCEQDEDYPDCVFLDVRMPGMDGLMLADALRAGPNGDKGPAVVFITGYEDYAVAAFERAAIDYLLKPVERSRLADTLKRLSAKQARSAPPLAPSGPTLRRLPIRMDYAVRLIDVDDIIAATAINKHVQVITREASYTTNYTLTQLEARLPPDLFARVHDSWIVALAEIVEIHNLGGQTYQLRMLTGGRQVPVSRRRLPLIQQRLGL